MAVIKALASRPKVFAGVPVSVSGAVTVRAGCRPNVPMLTTPDISVIVTFDPLLRHLILLFETSWTLPFVAGVALIKALVSMPMRFVVKVIGASTCLLYTSPSPRD